MTPKATNWFSACLVCLAIFFAPESLAAQGGEDASGSIRRVDASLSRSKVINPLGKLDIPIVKLTIKVTGEARDGHLWLACSYRHGGQEKDLRVKRVRGGGRGFAGRFSATLRGVETASDGSLKKVGNEMRVPWTVSLWRRQVIKSKCTRGEDGKPCEYCERNRYHMEDRVDTASGMAGFPMSYH